MVGDTYVPNVASFEEGFPPELPAPAGLREFSRWLADKPRSSLGWFHIESAPLEATYTGDDHATLRLRERLGIFMVFAQGGRLALWKPAEGPAVVVRLGADGEPSEVSPDLETFLVALARGETGIRDLEREQADTPAVRAELAAWLAAQGVVPSGRRLELGAFAAWWRGIRAEVAPVRPPLTAAAVPADLFQRIDPLLGKLIEDPRVFGFFESLGIDLAAITDPDALRAIVRPAEGVEFEVAWPWDRASEWLEKEYPKPLRKQLELRRARMFWSVTVFVAVDRRPIGRGRGEREFQPFVGTLPLDIQPGDDATTLEQKLGPPVRGSIGSRMWDFQDRRRMLIGAFNEGPFARTDLSHGELKSLTWRVSQSVSGCDHPSG
jgi:hypothetical protein